SYPIYRPITETGDEWEAFHSDDPSFEDVGDVGDEYLHRKPLNDVSLTHNVWPRSGESSCRHDNAVRIRKSVTALLNLPASSDLMGRSGEVKTCPITVWSTLWRGVPRVEYGIAVDNQATDHRLRVVWPVGQAERVMAEGAYDVVERPIQHPLEAEGALPFH